MRGITIAIIAIITIFGTACSKHKAKEGANASQATPAEQRRTLPDGAIAFDYAGHLYFDVTLQDSITARMAFDTGNTDIILDTEFYNKHFAHLGNLQRSVTLGAGNGLQGIYVDRSGWQYRVGVHDQSEDKAVVMNLQKILGHQVNGMFGMEFMQGRKVEFNYADGYMMVLPPDYQPADGYTCIKGKWLDERKVRILLPLNVNINNRVLFSGNFLVDLGSRGGLSLTSNSASKLNLGRVLTNVKKKIYDEGGVGGSRTDYLFDTNSISVANFEVRNLVSDYSGNVMGAMVDGRYDGLIGNAFLEHFDVIFDFDKCEIWLRPNRNYNIAKEYDSGITLTPQADGWIVNGMIEGGYAERAGLKRGDMIISINGLSAHELDAKGLKAISASDADWKFIVKRDNNTEKITVKKERD